MDLDRARLLLADLIEDYLREESSFDGLNARLREWHKQVANVPGDKDLENAFHRLQHYIADVDIREKDEVYGEAYGQDQREGLRLASARLRLKK